MTKEEKREYDKKYQQSNKEKIKKQKHEYYLANKEEILKRTHEYQQTNKEKKKEYDKKYQQVNKEKCAEATKRWQHKNPEKVGERYRRHSNKRRGLGSNALNKPFEGSEGHHINFNDVIYIPKELHRIVSHSVWTGKNMGLINNLAYQFLLGNYIVYK